MSIQCITTVGCLFSLFISNLYLTALTHFLMLSKKKKVAAISPCSLKIAKQPFMQPLNRNVSISDLPLEQPCLPGGQERGGSGRTFPLLSKCVNMMWFSCCNDSKIIHLRTRIITANSLMCTRVTLSLRTSIAVLRGRVSAGKAHCLPFAEITAVAPPHIERYQAACSEWEG